MIFRRTCKHGVPKSVGCGPCKGIFPIVGKEADAYLRNIGAQGYPHCDARILHSPGECEYCDLYPERQQERRNIGIAYTGHDPAPGEAPCPADSARPPGTDRWHGKWRGNIASSQHI